MMIRMGIEEEEEKKQTDNERSDYLPAGITFLIGVFSLGTFLVHTFFLCKKSPSFFAGPLGRQ